VRIVRVSLPQHAGHGSLARFTTSGDGALASTDWSSDALSARGSPARDARIELCDGLPLGQLGLDLRAGARSARHSRKKGISPFGPGSYLQPRRYRHHRRRPVTDRPTASADQGRLLPGGFGGHYDQARFRRASSNEAIRPIEVSITARKPYLGDHE
jgi:hypothetical protein